MRSLEEITIDILDLIDNLQVQIVNNRKAIELLNERIDELTN